MSMPSKWLPSMEAIRDNAVFVRLTRHSRWPSPRTTVWLFVAAFLVGTGDAAALLFIEPFLNTIAQLVNRVIFLSGPAVVLLSSPVAALVTIIATVTDMRSEAYRLMRVSILPREEIVSGYIYAALYRLRLLWVLEFGLLTLPTLVVATYWFWVRPTLTAIAALVTWAASIIAGIAVNWLAVCIAVWQSLCRKRVGTAIITTLALLSATGGLLSCASCLALDWVANREMGDAATALVCCLIHFLPIMGYAIPALTYTIRKKAKDCI
jgi:hypothetical protein